MHEDFPETNALLLKLVIETRMDAIFTWKKYLNEAFTTQKSHINHLSPIEKSTDEPVLKLLLNIAHAGLEIPSTSPNHWKLIFELVLKLNRAKAYSFRAFERLQELTTPNPLRTRCLLLSLTQLAQQFQLCFTTGWEAVTMLPDTSTTNTTPPQPCGFLFSFSSSIICKGMNQCQWWRPLSLATWKMPDCSIYI